MLVFAGCSALPRGVPRPRPVLRGVGTGKLKTSQEAAAAEQARLVAEEAKLKEAQDKREKEMKDMLIKAYERGVFKGQGEVWPELFKLVDAEKKQLVMTEADMLNLQDRLAPDLDEGEESEGSAIGFRLDSLLKLTDTRARNSKITLMHYLCKVLADKLSELLDFQKDFVSLEAASKMQLKYLAEEMQAISKGLEKVEEELIVSESDGPVSNTFRKTLKEFLVVAEADVRSLASLYSGVGRNADALALYFGEDPARCPFEQVVSTLLNFVRMFGRAHEDNCKQIELEKKKAQKEAENEMKTGAAKKELERKQIELERKGSLKEAKNEVVETGVVKKEPERLLRTPIESANIK